MTRAPSLDDRKKTALRWEIAWVVAIKIAIILLAGFTIFGARHRVHVDTALMDYHLLQNTGRPTTHENR